MSPGQLVRRLLGPRLFRPLGDAYRALFVDLEKVVRSFPELASGVHLLDVGGGDGQLINVLLRRFPSIRVTMIDISDSLGSALDAANLARVEVLPRTSITDYLASGRPRPDLVAVCDVVHHVPSAQRPQFFRDLAVLLGADIDLFVKEVGPGGLRSWLACMADRYITGDVHVSFLSQSELEVMVLQTMPNRRAQRTPLYAQDAPNYSTVFRGSLQADPVA
jgi:2-polyprenyl-3-methyl-5-hydroxy-6-metoxy-1,4-benzoquinol methylase